MKLGREWILPLDDRGEWTLGESTPPYRPIVLFFNYRSGGDCAKETIYDITNDDQRRYQCNILPLPLLQPTPRSPSTNSPFSFNQFPVLLQPTPRSPSTNSPFSFNQLPVLLQPTPRSPSTNSPFSFNQLPVLLQPTPRSPSTNSPFSFNQLPVLLQPTPCSPSTNSPFSFNQLPVLLQPIPRSPSTNSPFSFNQLPVRMFRCQLTFPVWLISIGRCLFVFNGRHCMSTVDVTYSRSISSFAEVYRSPNLNIERMMS